MAVHGSSNDSSLTCPTALQTTIKTVNYTHMMPTRYTLDVDLRTLFTNDVLAERKRQRETCQVGLRPNVRALQGLT